MAFATAYEGQQRLGRVLDRIEQCLHRVAHGLRQTRATEREVVAISVDVTPDVLALHDVLFETLDRGEQRVRLSSNQRRTWISTARASSSALVARRRRRRAAEGELMTRCAQWRARVAKRWSSPVTWSIGRGAYTASKKVE